MLPKVDVQHRIWVVFSYHQTKNSLEVVRRFKQQFPDVTPPAHTTFKAIYEKFMSTGSVLDQLKDAVERPATATSDENVQAVEPFFKTDKQPSIQKCAAKLQISPNSVQNERESATEIIRHHC